MGTKSGKGSISEPCERVPSPRRGVQPRTEAGEPAELSEVRQPPSVRDWRRCGAPRPPGDWEVTARPEPLARSAQWLGGKERSKVRVQSWSKPGYSSLECNTAAAAAAAAKSLQSCPTLCDPTDGSPLGSSVPGILQARILEWVAISFSNA